MTGQSQIIFHLRYDVNVIYLFPEVGFDVVFLLFNAKRKIDFNSILATDYHNVTPLKTFVVNVAATVVVVCFSF